MRKLILLLTTLLFCFFSYAQHLSGETVADSLPKPAYIIKWAPFSAIDIDPTIQLGLEYLLRGNWSLQQELGYGHYNYANTAMDGDLLWNKEVWRSRSEVRLYLSKFKHKPAGTYAALEFLYKRVNFDQEGSLGRECEGGRCSYFEKATYKVLRDVLGYHLKIGGQAIINKRIILEFYTGLGWRNIYVKTPGKGIDERTGEDESLAIVYPVHRGKYSLISGNLGFKVGYLIYRQ